ncbi:sulfite exporter TauE/SafE family protein [Paraglaciecola sp. MB-3u-78]|uniref:sulfite exporter TauE/SafE family protein n=1 Tax=Paraglaciecola sp. MB-3u-78 TaxID=2058332 RepID=UPI000C320C9D|nr:sulfite exporter TauE/SafE family protein [Paraglaciecola sp. MB-3u-78]PKH00644.1 sulfite exporter TauE/SafE family protein [Paraglaciecola sp. MB-3u-78]
MFLKMSAKHIRVFLLFVWLVILFWQTQTLTLIQEYGGFVFLGLLGAIFANATGAGGGVVFVPFFNQMDFSVATSVATSFAIQCCGMTAGALTWWAFYKQLKASNLPESAYWQPLGKALLLTVPPSVLGLWMVQINPQFFAHFSDPNSLHTGFGVFSIGLALAIFATVFLLSNQNFNTELTLFDYIFLPTIALVGGGITAWLSIGVGELVAVYLIIRRFNVTFAIAAAVILSALTVWGGIIFHLLITQAIYWPVVLFAGAGAIVGGILAKQLVLYFSAKNLKLFFAGWIFILGITSLPF